MQEGEERCHSTMCVYVCMCVHVCMHVCALWDALPIKTHCCVAATGWPQLPDGPPAVVRQIPQTIARLVLDVEPGVLAWQQAWIPPSCGGHE